MALVRCVARPLRLHALWMAGCRAESNLALADVSWTGIGVPEHMLGKLPKLGIDHPTPVQAEAVVRAMLARVAMELRTCFRIVWRNETHYWTHFRGYCTIIVRNRAPVLIVAVSRE